jgi:hypothetical protein
VPQILRNSNARTNTGRLYVLGRNLSTSYGYSSERPCRLLPRLAAGPGYIWVASKAQAPRPILLTGARVGKDYLGHPIATTNEAMALARAGGETLSRVAVKIAVETGCAASGER